MTYEEILNQIEENGKIENLSEIYAIMDTWKKPIISMEYNNRLRIILRNYCVEKAVKDKFYDIDFYDSNHNELTYGKGTNNPDFITKDGKTAELKTGKNLMTLYDHYTNWHNADKRLFYSVEQQTLYELDKNYNVVNTWKDLQVDERWKKL